MITMSEETIISDLYQTKIELSNYQPSIDDTITATVTLLDFNNQPVTGEGVNLACNGNVVKSANTDTNGQITASISCSEWGVMIFTANEATVTCHVTGWRSKQVLGGNGGVATLYVNEDAGLCRLSYLLSPGPKLEVSSGGTTAFDKLKVDTQNTNKADFIDIKYLPKATVKGICTVPYVTIAMSGFEDSASQTANGGTLGYFSTEARSAGAVAIGVDLIWNI